MSVRSRPVGGAVLVVAVAAGLSGCSGATEGETTNASASELYADYVTQAEDGGAGEEQLEALRSAERSGELTFETVNSLVQESLDCMAAAGISSEWWEPSELAPDYKAPAYSFAATADGLTEDEVVAVADQCLYEHSYWAEMARQDPRAFQDEFDAQLRAELPSVLECLDEHGIEVDDDATLDEIRQASAELAMETSEATDGEGMVLCTEQQPSSWD